MNSKLLQCPYDASHLVAAKSFAQHLCKCQRQHPDIKLVRCHLNTSHLVKEEKLKEHMRTCPSRDQFESYKYNVITVASSNVTMAVDPAENLILNTSAPKRNGLPEGKSLQEDDECWDDFSYKSYNPVEKCQLQKETDTTFILPKANQFIGQHGEGASIKSEPGSSKGDETTTIKVEVESEDNPAPEISSRSRSERQTPRERDHSQRNRHEGYSGKHSSHQRHGDIEPSRRQWATRDYHDSNDHTQRHKTYNTDRSSSGYDHDRRSSRDTDYYKERTHSSYRSDSSYNYSRKHTDERSSSSRYNMFKDEFSDAGSSADHSQRYRPYDSQRSSTSKSNTWHSTFSSKQPKYESDDW